MLSTGTTVAERYTIQSLIGHGGMGAVYRARDDRLGRDVALKILRADLAADLPARQRFLREGQIAAQFVHPNVVRTYDAGESTSGPYLVQEYITGKTLDQLIPLPPRRAAAVLRPIASALGFIHERGYVHCDVKPQNIMLRDDGTPVLLDFGIARAQGVDTTSLIATPHYLAPERAQGNAASPASDLYALGVVLYHAIEGRPPFDGASVHTIIQQHLSAPVPALTNSDAASPVLDRIIARLTAKKPGDRYSSAAEVATDLEAVERSGMHDQPTVVIGAPAMVPAATNVASVVPPSPMQAASPAHPAAPAPPSPASSVAPSRSQRTAWASMPSWRRRRWTAAVLAPVLLLLLGLGLARAANRDRAVGSVSPQVETGLPATATTAVVAGTAVATPTLAPSSSEVVVPSVIGLSFDEAAALLARHGLVAHTGEVRPATEPPNTVLDTTPLPSAAVPAGASVILHVSAGPAADSVPPVVEQPAPVQTVDDKDDKGNQNDKDDEGNQNDKDDKEDKGKERGKGKNND